MTATRTFERTLRFLVPSWLSGGDGDAVLRSLARQIDESVDRFREGLDARFPSRAINTAGALRLLGQDRGIVQGRAETDAHYAERLLAWRHPRGHRVRGSAWALLAQIAEYWGSAACQTIDRNGNLYEHGPRGEESVTHGYSWAWDDVSASQWSRFWVVVDGSTSAVAVPDAPGEGGALWATGDLWGFAGATWDDVAAMRRLMTGRAWRPAGTQPEWLVITLDPLLSAGVGWSWDATFDETFGDPAVVAPDATWVHWSAQDGSGIQRPARDPRCRFISYDPDHNNIYAGDPTLFCLGSVLLDATICAGDPDTFPTGLTYDGSPASFPTLVRLIDDGDPAP